MPKQRYEISDAESELVSDPFNSPRRTGRPQVDDRLMFNGVFWVLCSGAAWRDMPDRYGPWSTVYQRFRDWRNQGTFNKMLKRMHVKLNAQGLIDLETWCIDSTQSKRPGPHQEQAKRGGGRTSGPRAWAKSGGLKTKFICSATPVVCLCTSPYLAGKPAISHMLNRYPMVSRCPPVGAGLASGAASS